MVYNFFFLFWIIILSIIIKFCEKFQEQKNIINIDPETSAFRLIQKSNIVISVPFTSTAFIADFFNKRSLFYDPKKLIYKDDRGLQDIPLLSGFEELLNYFKNLENE